MRAANGDSPAAAPGGAAPDEGVEILKSYAFLFWAYNVVWIVLAGYLLYLVLRLRHVGRRLDGLEREMQRRRIAESSDQGSSSS